MLAGVQHGISKEGIVKHAARDLDLSLQIKRERIRMGAGVGYDVFGQIETVYIEPDRDCQLERGEVAGVGRRLYWPHNGPFIARSRPEGDLLIPSRLPLRRGWAAMPDVPDPTRPVANPYGVDRSGASHLKIDEVREAPLIKQDLARIASAKFANFLVFHPISQIVFIFNAGQGGPRFASIGNVKQPISALTGWDGSKLSLLIDPYTGEMIFKGGRYAMSDRLDLAGTA
jgi:hypothetical protein